MLPIKELGRETSVYKSSRKGKRSGESPSDELEVDESIRVMSRGTHSMSFVLERDIDSPLNVVRSVVTAIE